MKRRVLIIELEKMGCVFIRHGGKQDWYQNPNTKISQSIPRHREIKVFIRGQNFERSLIKK